MAVHSLACFFTTYFGDDYYYAAFLKNGLKYFISENIVHYRHTNGRVIVHILDELLIGWSFNLWRIANIIAVGLLLVAAAKIASRSYRIDIASRKDDYRVALAASCAMFAITDVAVLRQSVYWATGSLNYLFPTTATLWFYYCFRRDFERFEGSYTLIPAAFFASITTEQASAAAMLVTLCFTVSSFTVKRLPPRPAYIGAFISSLVGLCTLLLAPGNAERKTYYPEFYKLSFFGKIEKNSKELAGIVFGRGGIYPILCISFVLIILICLKNYSGSVSSRPKRIAASLLAGETALALGLYIRGITSQQELLEQKWMAVLVIIPLLSAMIWTLVRYFKKGDIDSIYFVWCSVSMQIVMLISPEYGPRTLFISIASLWVPAIRLITDNHNPAVLSKVFKYPAFNIAVSIVIFAIIPMYIPSIGRFAVVAAAFAVAAVIAVSLFGAPDAAKLSACFVLALCFAQFASVADGYHENVKVIRKNQIQVEEFKKSDSSPFLVLYYLPNEFYRYTMPYDGKYHEAVFLKLYGIPADTVVCYEFVSSD